MIDAINHFDLAFVVDTTGSMGSFIAAAQRLMNNMIAALLQNSNVNMQIGLVEYSDHPPQDTVLTIVYPLGTPKDLQQKIKNIKLHGGGDGPEAVFDGISDACNKLKWRKHSRKVIVLVGDSPPHGVGGAGDGFPRGCPCGQTVESVSAMCEEKGVTLYAIILSSTAKESFTSLSRLTGGEAFDSSQGEKAVEKVQQILEAEFSNIELDKSVLESWTEESTVDDLAAKMELKVSDVANSVMRLRSRGLIPDRVLV